MTEYNTRVDYIYQGGDTTFSVPFPYINKSHIFIIINGDTENPITQYEWLSENQIKINEGVIETGDTITVQRQTPIDEKMVVFTDNNILDAESQNLAQDQVFNTVQEVRDSQNELNDNMTQFVNIKDTLLEQIQSIGEMGQKAETVIDLMQDTQTLVNDITNTFNDLKEQTEKGLNCTVTHNLFTINVTDKELSESELTGWGEQNSTQSYDNYPDAYTELLDEYTSGTLQVYSSSDASTYVKSFNGSSSGNFYIPYADTLAVGTTVYNEIGLSTEKGDITYYENIEADEYSGSITDSFFTAKDAAISVNTNVYSDNILSQSLGTITDIKEVNTYKYEGGVTGNFYVPAGDNLLTGDKIYSDIPCLNEKGTITFIGEMTSDKYHITGYDEFYVPEGTEINVGTVIYKDAALNEPLGTVTQKGLKVSQGAYYYKIPNWQLHKWDYVLGKIGNNVYFYTKEAINIEEIPITKSVICYRDSECTQESFELQVTLHPDYPPEEEIYMGIILHFRDEEGNIDTHSGALFIAQHIPLISRETAANTSYICINNGTDKLAYYKQATVTSNVLSVNEGDYESYTLKEQLSGTYIKIGSLDYQTYDKTGTLSNTAIKIGANGTLEAVTDTGIKTSTGIVFEYKLAANGHKIVDSKYSNALSSLILSEDVSEYYMLNQADRTFTLPLLDNSKHLYFCCGNTILNRAVINTVTENQLNTKLADYVTLAQFNQAINTDLLQAVLNIITSYNENLEDIQTSLGELEEITDDILGEESV